jgi:uncharacterized protein (DUF2267 family)
MTQAQFFKRVCEHAACDRRRAEAVTFAVFQELRDRLTPDNALNVAAQLPRDLRAMWLENERDRDTVRKTHQYEFIGQVRNFAALPDDKEAERAVRAVFAALQEALGSPTGREGESWRVFSQLPKDLKRLWLAAHEQRP